MKMLFTASTNFSIILIGTYLFAWCRHQLDLCHAFTTIPCLPVQTPYRTMIENQYFHNTRSLTLGATQVGIIDGASLSSLKSFLRVEGLMAPSSNTVSKSKDKKVGYCFITTGYLTSSSDNNSKSSKRQKVIGVVVAPPATDSSATDEKYGVTTIVDDDGKPVIIYTHSLAHIPSPSISDNVAISTYMASLTGIHCSVYDPEKPVDGIVSGIGGSNDEFVPDINKSSQNDFVTNKHVVIMGGSDYASFLADGLSTLGCKVTQITTSKNILPRKISPNVSILPPAVGSLELSFSNALGKFDCLVDTLSNEMKSNDDFFSFPEESNDIDDKNLQITKTKSSVINELKRQNGCNRYISTLNTSQQIVRDDGLLFGPKKVDEYMKMVSEKVSSSKNKNNISSQYQYMIPPKQFGSKTIQKLFDSNILFPNYSSSKTKDVCLQGWSLKDFWELSTWPRDSSSGANVRFGLPVVDEDQVNFGSNARERMISAPPKAGKLAAPAPKDEYEGMKNPFVMTIEDLSDLQKEIISTKKSSILFLSSSKCRTCKYLTPQFTRIARIWKEEYENDIIFAKTDTNNEVGKQVSRVLNIDAVPMFVMFRDGKRYGDSLSVSKIPSKSFDLALEYLAAGKEWDRGAINN